MVGDRRADADGEMATPPQRRSRTRAPRIAVVVVAVAAVAAALYSSGPLAGIPGSVPAEGRAVSMASADLRLPAPLSQLRYGARAKTTAGARPPVLHAQGDGLLQVTRPGDLVFVDAAGAIEDKRVTIYLTNLASLRRSYAAIALPLVVWEATPSSEGRWTRSTSVPATFLTDASGKVSFTVPGGRYYDITLGRGGSLLALPGRKAIAPAFFAAAD